MVDDATGVAPGGSGSVQPQGHPGRVGPEGGGMAQVLSRPEATGDRWRGVERPPDVAHGAQVGCRNRTHAVLYRWRPPGNLDATLVAGRGWPSLNRWCGRRPWFFARPSGQEAVVRTTNAGRTPSGRRRSAGTGATSGRKRVRAQLALRPHHACRDAEAALWPQPVKVGTTSGSTAGAGGAGGSTNWTS